jgi:hypothetical protein
MPSEPKAERLSISMPSDLLAAARNLADERGGTLSGYVQQLVSADLRERGRLPQPDDPRQEILPIIDALFASGRGPAAMAALHAITVGDDRPAA